jgi:hypothetical protein
MRLAVSETEGQDPLLGVAAKALRSRPAEPEVSGHSPTLTPRG